MVYRQDCLVYRVSMTESYDRTEVVRHLAKDLADLAESLKVVIEREDGISAKVLVSGEKGIKALARSTGDSPIAARLFQAMLNVTTKMTFCSVAINGTLDRVSVQLATDRHKRTRDLPQLTFTGRLPIDQVVKLVSKTLKV